MKEQLQSGTSDKLAWYKNHTLSEDERKKKIDEKVNRAVKFVAARSQKKK